MTRTEISILAAVAFVAGAARAEAPTSLDDAVSSVSKRIAAAVKCGRGDRDPHRTWCAVTRVGGGRGDPLALPKAPTTYFGVTVALHPGEDVREAFLKWLSPSALHLGPDGARLTAIRGDNDDERKQLLDAAMSAALVLKGEATTVTLPKGLADYLDGQRAKPLRPLTLRGPTAGDFTGQIPARLLRSGDVYVVVEPAADGIFVNVYPIAPIARR
jgi:hypothetical protein